VKQVACCGFAPLEQGRESGPTDLAFLARSRQARGDQQVHLMLDGLALAPPVLKSIVTHCTTPTRPANSTAVFHTTTRKPMLLLLATDRGRLAWLTEAPHFPPGIEAIQDKSDPKRQQQNQYQPRNAHDRAPVVCCDRETFDQKNGPGLWPDSNKGGLLQKPHRFRARRYT
jgi:hypothetical protein